MLDGGVWGLWTWEGRSDAVVVVEAVGWVVSDLDVVVVVDCLMEKGW